MKYRKCSAAIVATIALAGCGGGPAPSNEGASVSWAPATASAAPGAVVSDAPSAGPDPRDLPLVEVPAGYRIAETVDFGFGMVREDLFLGWNMDTAEFLRRDAATHEALETLVLGTPGSFPPDVQAASPGTGGIWINFPSRHAAGLVDPATGEILRLVKILGNPYDMVEVGTELWIADFEWSEITRYDLANDKVLATIPVSSPTDILFADGAIWLPVHLGRKSEEESIEGPGGQVIRIDPTTNEVLARVKVGHRPYYLASGFGSIWTGNATSATVSRVDVATNKAIQIPIAEDGAFAIAVAGDSVWAAVGPQWPPERVCDPATSFFVRIDPATNAVRERVAFPCAGGFTPLEDGSLWVSGAGADGPTSVRYEPVGS